MLPRTVMVLLLVYPRSWGAHLLSFRTDSAVARCLPTSRAFAGGSCVGRPVALSTRVPGPARACSAHGTGWPPDDGPIAELPLRHEGCSGRHARTPRQAADGRAPALRCAAGACGREARRCPRDRERVVRPTLRPRVERRGPPRRD